MKLNYVKYDYLRRIVITKMNNIVKILLLVVMMWLILPPAIAYSGIKNANNYADLVYYIILWSIFGSIALLLPIIHKLDKWFSSLSFGISGWFYSGVVILVFNIATPTVDLLSFDVVSYLKMVFTIIFMLIFTLIKEQWITQKK